MGSPRRSQGINEISIIVNNVQLDRVGPLNYLEVIFNESLAWTHNLENLPSKVNKRLGLPKRIRHLLPISARLLLYNTIVLPVFDYTDIIWGD